MRAIFKLWYPNSPHSEKWRKNPNADNETSIKLKTKCYCLMRVCFLFFLCHNNTLFVIHCGNFRENSLKSKRSKIFMIHANGPFLSVNFWCYSIVVFVLLLVNDINHATKCDDLLEARKIVCEEHERKTKRRISSQSNKLCLWRITFAHTKQPLVKVECSFRMRRLSIAFSKFDTISKWSRQFAQTISSSDKGQTYRKFYSTKKENEDKKQNSQ